MDLNPDFRGIAKRLKARISDGGYANEHSEPAVILAARLAAVRRTLADLCETAAGKLDAREGELKAKAGIIEGLEGQVRRLERRVGFRDERIKRLKGDPTYNAHKMLAKNARIRELEEEVKALRTAVNPRKHSPLGDLRKQLGLKDVVPFGQKHYGESIAHIVVTDPDYLLWMLREHSTHRPTSEAVLAAIDHAAGVSLRTAPAHDAIYLDFESQPDAVVSVNGVQHAVNWKGTPRDLRDLDALYGGDCQQESYFWLGRNGAH